MKFPRRIPSQTVLPICILAQAFLVLAAYPAGAEPLLTADSAAKLAREKNPEIVAARHLIEEAQDRMRTTGRASNPELESELAGGQDFEGRVSIGIRQRFPLTARLRLERTLSGIEVEMARLEVLEREWQIEVAARTAFYELAAIRESGALARRQTALAEAFAKSVGEGLAQGFGSKFDGQQASLTADELRIAQEGLRADEMAASARLNGLLGRPADAALSINESLDLPKSIPAARPVGRRADLELAEMSVRAGATDVSLAKANRWDDVGVGVFVEGERFRDQPEGIEPEALVGVQFSVPLPIWQNGSGKVAEKEAAQARKTQQVEALRFAVRNEVLSAHQILSVRYRSATQVRDKLLPAARENLAEAEAAYGRAELDIQTVFRVRERLAEIELAALAARKIYFFAYASWLGALGEPTTKP